MESVEKQIENTKDCYYDTLNEGGTGWHEEIFATQFDRSRTGIWILLMIDMREPAQRNTDLIEELQSKIQILENENRLLKELLDEAGVSYADKVSVHDELMSLYDPNQGARIKKFEVTDKVSSAA